MLNVDDFFAPSAPFISSPASRLDDLDVHNPFLSSGSAALFEPIFSSSSLPTSSSSSPAGAIDLTNGSDAEDEGLSNSNCGFNFLLDFETSLLANNNANPTTPTTATATTTAAINDVNDDTTILTTMSSSSPSLSSSSVASLSSPSSSPSPMPLSMMPESSIPHPSLSSEQGMLFSPDMMDLDSLMLGPSALMMQLEQAGNSAPNFENPFTATTEPATTTMMMMMSDETEEVASSSPMSSSSSMSLSSSSSASSSSPRSSASLSPPPPPPPPKNRKKSGKSAAPATASTIPPQITNTATATVAPCNNKNKKTEETNTATASAIHTTATATATTTVTAPAPVVVPPSVTTSTTTPPTTTDPAAKKKDGTTETGGTKRKREDTSKPSQKDEQSSIEFKQSSANPQEDLKEAKRMRRLMKNRESAHASRERKRQYIESLEKRVSHLTGHANGLTNRVCTLENENSALRERLRQLEASKPIPATPSTPTPTTTTTTTTKTNPAHTTTTAPKLPLPPLRPKNSVRNAPSFFGQFAPRFINGTLSMPLNQIPQAGTIARNAAKATMLCIVLFAVAFMITNSGNGNGGSGGDTLDLERAVSEAASAALSVEGTELPHVRIGGRILHDFVPPTEEQVQLAQQALDDLLSSMLNEEPVTDVLPIKQEEEEEKEQLGKPTSKLEIEIVSGRQSTFRSGSDSEPKLPNCNTESPLISVKIEPLQDGTTPVAINTAVNQSLPLLVASCLAKSDPDSDSHPPITIKMEEPDSL